MPMTQIETINTAKPTKLKTAILLFIAILILFSGQKDANTAYLSNNPATLRGKITNSQGEPLAGVVITCSNKKLGTYTTKSDKQGKYFLKLPSYWKAYPGTIYKITVTSIDYPKTTSSLRLIQNKNYTKNFVLKDNPPGDSIFIKGRLLDEDTNNPLAKAKITLKDKNSSFLDSTTTNTKGQFSLNLNKERGLLSRILNPFNLPSSIDLTIIIEKPGFKTYISTLKLKPGKRYTYNFTLKDTLPPGRPIFKDIPSITNKDTLSITGEKEKGTSLYLNNRRLIDYNNNTTFKIDITLKEGKNTFTFYTQDKAKNQSPPSTITIIKDTIAPEISSLRPSSGAVIQTKTTSLSGKVQDNDSIDALTINGSLINLNQDNTFILDNISLSPGDNLFFIEVTDRAGNTKTLEHHIFSQIKTSSKQAPSNKPIIERESYSAPLEISSQSRPLSLNKAKSSTAPTYLTTNISYFQAKRTSNSRFSNAKFSDTNTPLLPFVKVKKSSHSQGSQGSSSRGSGQSDTSPAAEPKTSTSKSEEITLILPYNNQIITESRLQVYGRYKADDVIKITVNNQSCTIDKDTKTFTGPILISPGEARRQKVDKDSEEYIIMKVDQDTHSGLNKLTAKMTTLNGTYTKEITYYYYQLFVKLQTEGELITYDSETGSPTHYETGYTQACNLDLFKEPPFNNWKDTDCNTRLHYPPWDRLYPGKTHYIQLDNPASYCEEVCPWLARPLEHSRYHSCDHGESWTKKTVTLHTPPAIDSEIKPFILIFRKCDFIETCDMFAGDDRWRSAPFYLKRYKVDGKSLQPLSGNFKKRLYSGDGIPPFNDCYVILDEYRPDRDMELVVEAPSYSFGHPPGFGFSAGTCSKYVIFQYVETLTADILVDSNNDGILDGDDNASETTLPGHVFWVNNDDDYDESTVHPDDKDAKNSSGNDSSDSFINGIRDLEDFTPVNIKIPYIKQILQSKEDNLKNITFYLKAKGSGRINVYKKE